MLRPGSTIAAVAPSGVHDPARLAAGVALVESWGYSVRVMPHVGEGWRYLAAPAAARAADLRAAWTAPDVHALWFVRGGFGTAHLLDGLTWDEIDERPVIGFSDATALFAALQARGRGRGVHGPVLHHLADHPDPASVAALRALLAGEGAPPLPGLQVAGPPAPVEGPLVGGNLCVLASLCGTPWALRAAGSVLLLEDIHEPAYKIDRMLTQLLQAGCLDGVRGVALGEFTGCAAGPGYSVEDVVVERLSGLGVPVLSGLPVGHGTRNHAWVVGAPVRLDGAGLRVA